MEMQNSFKASRTRAHSSLKNLSQGSDVSGKVRKAASNIVVLKQASKLFSDATSSGPDPNSPTKIIKKQMSKIQMLVGQESVSNTNDWISSLSLEEKVDAIMRALVENQENS